MGLAGEWRRRISMLVHRGRFQRELDEEIRLHVELRRQQQREAGLSEEAAKFAAQRRFGNVTRMKEKSHMAWGWSWLETLWQDAGYGLRSMLRTPAVTVVALISLALGIGANTAIFSFLDAVMLRSLPVRAPQEVVKLGVEDWGGITDSFVCTELYSYPFYRQLQRRNAVFAQTAAAFSMTNDVHGFIDNRQQSQLIHVQTVSGTYFPMLGVGAAMGRMLNDGDDASEGDHPVVVISNGFWKRELGGDPGVLSHKLKLGNVVFDVVGVAPAEFFGTTVGEAPDAWAPLSMAGLIPPGWGKYKDDFSESLHILGRLKPGVSMQQAAADVNVLYPEILRSFPDAKLTQEHVTKLSHSRVELKSMARGISDLRHTYSEPLKILMAIVALVLLIACANIANLLLARSTARARELALRQALGAGRMRIVRQLLTESLLLALAGGALGIGFASGASRLLLEMISRGPDTVRLDVSLNVRLLAFTVAVTLGTALLFGTLPAFRATSLRLTESLKSGRGAAGAGKSPLAKVLVVSQVALSLVLMVGACLFIRTLVNLNHIDAGFNKGNVLRLDIDSAVTGYNGDDPRLKAMFRQIEDRVDALPGVQAASFSAFTFLEGNWSTAIRVDGMPLNRGVNVRHNIVGDGFFKTMQIPLVAGRNFGREDTAAEPAVSVISESMARNLFPSGSPIGRTYSIGADDDGGDPPAKKLVIGVVKDVKVGSVKEGTHYIDYFPYSQADWRFGDLEVRYRGDFSAISKEVQGAIHGVDSRLPITDITTLEEQVARSYSDEGLIARLSAFFALVAVFLSCIGLYGLMSYLVGRRTGEIGIRMALGANRAEIGGRVMREIGVLIFAGIAIGLPATLFGVRLVRTLLYGLSGSDPLSLAAAVVLLIVAGTAAGYFPARRAARINPIVALREE